MAWPGTVNAYKDTAPQGYKPILLATFTFIDGSVVRFSTDPFNTAEGGYQYGGNDYFARIDSQDIGALQARSEQGIDRIPNATIHLFNADQFIWTNYEMYPAQGFKGAILTLAVILMNIELDGTFSYSTDAPQKYTGICSAPILENGGQTFTVLSTSSRNMARVFLPPVLIQSRCPWVFPATAAERLAAASSPSSASWECAYNPDQACTDPETGASGIRGNFVSGSTPYTVCNKTKQDCVLRGMYSVDSSARHTGTFGGEQWQPLDRETRSKSYVEGKSVTVFNSGPSNAWSRPIPFLYGKQWVKDPPIVSQIGDGNSTRFEAVVCLGDIGASGILEVVVNGVIVPPNQSGGDPLFRHNFGGNPLQSFTGGRLGSATKDAGWNDSSGNPQGDPHGSRALQEIVVYRQLADSGSKPNVQILAQGPKIWVFTDQTTKTKVYSNNPAWVLLDLLTWGNWQYAQIDMASFITAAAFCDVSIPYVDLNGVTSSHPRYSCEFALMQRRSAGELIQQTLNCFNAQLVPNSTTGLLQLFIRQTLGDQQPTSAPSGSNYATAISSVHATGGAVNGYAAYLIDESVIASDGSGMPKVRYYSRANSDTPNRVAFGFQDADNSYNDDSISIVDATDAARSGGYQGSQEVVSNLPVLGVSNFDQGIRIANCFLAENLRGNEAGDTRGSRYIDVEIQSGVRVSHLRVGHIVVVSYQALSLSLQTFRVIAIAPTTNFFTCKLSLQWHSDTWYTDAYGQSPAQLYSNPGRLGNSLPYPWKANTAIPVTGDQMFDPTNLNFDIAQAYTNAADGSALPVLSIQGRLPANDLSATQPPFVPLQGVTAASGGSIAAGTYYLALCAIDSAGKYSALSRVVRAQPASGTANTIGITGIVWQAGTVDYAVFAGPTELQMCYQADSGHAGTPGTVTMTALKVASFGPPDLRFDHFLPEVKEEIHSGVWAAEVSVVTSTTLKFNTATFTVNQFAGKTISLLYSPTTVGALPVINLRVASNTADTLTIGANSAGVSPPNLTTILFTGDLMTLRAHGSIASATTIGDANFVNFYEPGGLATDDEVNNVVHILAGTGAGQSRAVISNTSTTCTISPWDTIPDSTSIWVIAEPTWRYAKYTSTAQVSDPNPAAQVEVAVMSVANVENKPWLVRMITCDHNDVESLDRFAQIREIYQVGSQGSPLPPDDGYYHITPSGGHIAIDTANGINQSAALTTNIIVDAPSTGGILAGQRLVLKLIQDATGGRQIDFTTAGVFIGLTNKVADMTGTSYTMAEFIWNAVNWELKNWDTGLI